MSDLLPSAVLEHEHREIDGGLAAFRQGLDSRDWNRAALAAADTELRDHIWVEETVLFPWLRQGGLVAPIMVMVREHGQIWRALDALAALAEAATDGTAAASTYAELAAILDAHNTKEEAIVYPAADRVLDSEQSQKLRDALESAAGDRPATWVCQALSTR